jgi:hypothetical protein
VRARTITSIAAVAGAAAIGYASVIERNWFALRAETVPVLPSGADPLRVLHISDIHLTPGRHRLMAFVRSLAALDPDLVINTGDSIASADALGPLLDSLGPLLDKPGAFVYGSNDLFSPQPKNPARYLWRTSAGDHERETPDLPWEKLGGELASSGWLDLNNQRGRLRPAAGRAYPRRPAPRPRLRRARHQLRHRPGPGQRALHAPAGLPRRWQDGVALRLRRTGHLPVGAGQVRLPPRGDPADAGPPLVLTPFTGRLAAPCAGRQLIR